MVYPATPSARPGRVDVELGRRNVTVSNSVLKAVWTLDKGSMPRLRPVSFSDRVSGVTLDLPLDAFALRLGASEYLRSSTMYAMDGFRISSLEPRAESPRLAEAFGGFRVSAELRSRSDDIFANWSVELRDGSHYVRQAVAFATTRRDVTLHEIVLFDSRGSVGRRVGTADLPGAVVAIDPTFFIGYEHPDACNGEGGIPEEGGGVILSRFVPGERRGKLFYDVDVTHVVLPGHAFTVYVENHRNDAPLRLLGVELLSSAGSGLLQQRQASTGTEGTTSRSRSTHNFATFEVPAEEGASALRDTTWVLRFHLAVDGNYDKEWVFGLQRRGLKGRVYCSLRQTRELRPDARVSGSLVLGVSPRGQLRRGFLAYLERERAHPSRAVLHYNTWYSVGTGDMYKAGDAQAAVEQVLKALAERGVHLDAMLLDDGWDDPDAALYEPSAQFAQGMQDFVSRMQELRVGLGVWFSPFGGYNEPRQRRLRSARLAGLPVREEPEPRVRAVDRGAGACSEAKPCGVGEGGCGSDADCVGHLICFLTQVGISPPGVDTSQIEDPDRDFCSDPGVRSAFLSLTEPAYFEYFVGVVRRWLEQGAVMLKLDGVGDPAGRGHTSAHDWDATLRLLWELRASSPDIFINLSTGTWASPFWLLSADTIWRRGHDHYFEGVGVPRERWITYRDGRVYAEVVAKSPFFPLNSLMIHGIIYAESAWDLTEPLGGGRGSAAHFQHEVRSAFASGTMLQELYVTPARLTARNWDDLAEAAAWARSATAVMADAHWLGGDPNRLEVYGWAAWRDQDGDGDAPRAILAFRNPRDIGQKCRFEPGAVLELPQHAALRQLRLWSPFADQRLMNLTLEPDSQFELELLPFEVLVFDSSTFEFTRPQRADAEEHGDGEVLEDVCWNAPPGAVVSCGGHEARCCAGCPQGHGDSWCNGDCEWRNDDCRPRMVEEPEAVLPDPCGNAPQGSEVSCGGHKARCCAGCPRGNGESWCNGECEWRSNGCYPRYDELHVDLEMSLDELRARVEL